MFRYLLAAVALLVSLPAAAQNATSGSPRVQGVPDGYGDPVQVTIVAANGADTTGSTAAQVQGNVALDAVDSGNPVKIGGVAAAAGTPPAAVAAGDRVNAVYTPKGAQWISLGTANSVTGAGGSSNVLVPLADFDSYYPLATVNYGWNGTAIVQQAIDVNGTAASKGLSITRWRYTSGASPILSNTTTAVTIKTAAGASVKNAIDSCQLTTTAFTASVPLAIRDGAAGTVMWALTVPTVGFLQPVSIVFEQPLVGTANTLLEVVTTTANTAGTVTLNCQGHTES